MSRTGFIHGKLDIKLLILYIMSRAVPPVEHLALLDLALCDAGVDYFLFSEALSELFDSGHLERDASGSGYTITEKGREHGETCENSLPYSVRLRCDENLAHRNAVFRRREQVRAQVTELDGEGGATVRLSLSDEEVNLFTLELYVPTRAQGERIASRYQERPEQIYHQIAALFLQEQTD